MGLLELFVAASIPVLKVLLITGLGTYLALDSVSILGDEARKHVNNLVFYIYNPALVASNLAKTITYDSMIKLWFMPFNILITFIIGSILGWIVILFTQPPLHLQGLILGCCAAGNLGNMLFIIIPAVCKEKGSPFGSPDECHSDGMAYSSLSMAIGAIYIWSYVYNIVRMSSTRSIEESTTNDSSNGKSFRGTSTSELESCMEPLLPSEHVNQYILPCTRSDGKAEVSVSNKIKQQLRMVFRDINWKLLFAPSTIGAIVGFLVGLIPQIRKLMIGDAAPLRVIQNSASFLGDGAIATTTLIVGGNLLKGLKGPGIQKSLIIGVVAARYIALPLAGILVVKGALHFGLLQADPLYQFILLLQFALPPAMNIGTMTQLFGAGESECSVIMLWTYALSSISLTLWSTIFMWLVAKTS
ncbi:putative Auxin efflux carrier family protein [Tripterygium wilfordii]|uniref:Putative Auxin efflux carrier family protein n=1 Tax=Tripterygium wilfordii TaxID=458696 RepID=A0A7J7DLL5_TRIWF|nr:protein PIN-LIKES 3-like [Tripterygium wilfordii]XP_038702623.1 protein PIN-LIKES 3-like [Tripterygium wilfordii]KAF5747262.1 putative Auxin efflux carrier family protein [Tripterygium wilfordii]